MRSWPPFALALALALGGCYAVPAPVEEPPPVVQPPPTFPPPQPPSTPPADVAAFLDRIAIGATVAEANAAVGQAAVIVTATGGAPTTARWNLPGFMVFAVVVDGRITRKAATPVESN